MFFFFEFLLKLDAPSFSFLPLAFCLSSFTIENVLSSLSLLKQFQLLSEKSCFFSRFLSFLIYFLFWHCGLKLYTSSSLLSL